MQTFLPIISSTAYNFKICISSNNQDMEYLSTLISNNKTYKYYDLAKVCRASNLRMESLPYSIKVLFENITRKCGAEIIRVIDEYRNSYNKQVDIEIPFSPARVLMQDFTGVPAVVDLAAMRDAMKEKAAKVNPLIPVDLIIDHSITVDSYNHPEALAQNMKIEFERNHERYEFLHWGQQAFDNFKVVPPGTGICHQVNLEYLAQVVFCDEQNMLYPDTVFGTDSHTTMVNSLAVLGWGVGGIEAEAAMLGQPTSMLLPKVLGLKLIGQLEPGVNATDLVLKITSVLRAKGVVGKFVEFFGDGLNSLTLADRATISNMAPEYGATCGFFPIDNETIHYLELTNRSPEHIDLVKKYAELQGLWYDAKNQAKYDEVLELDLNTVQASMAGPRRPQDLVTLPQVVQDFEMNLPKLNKNSQNIGGSYEVKGQNYKLTNGSVVIAAITSCTNTSNPFALIGAGLLAKKAVEMGLTRKPWVKTSLAPGSQVAEEYLRASGLLPYLEQLGFYIVGYGCTTCIGNSGPLDEPIASTISDNQLVVVGVLSGNRNFEGRIHPLVRANYLASPMLCVLYALAGNIYADLTKEVINNHSLAELWPSNAEIYEAIRKFVNKDMFANKYKEVFKGNEIWNKIPSQTGNHYSWNKNSTYIQNPPYFRDTQDSNLLPINKARILAVFGDSITTDHISPAGSIAANSPAAKYLLNSGVAQKDFNSYGARRGAHEVMMRGTFANIRLRNKMLSEIEGGYTLYHPSKEIMSMYDAAMGYQLDKEPVVIFAGKEYGTGSSRDWAAKGTKLLGVKAVIAESFERIHRSNLVGMGVIPFVSLVPIEALDLVGDELVSLPELNYKVKPKQEMKGLIHRSTGEIQEFSVLLRADTELEIEYLKKGSILHYVLHQLDNLN